MPDTPTFVVNDRRKFTSEGELRHDAPPSDTAPAGDDRTGPQLVAATATQGAVQPVLNISTPALEQLSDLPESGGFDQPLAGEASFNSDPQPPYPDAYAASTPMHADPRDPAFEDDLGADALGAGPTSEENEQALRAYEATVERLDIAMRSADPGAERMPPMSFERLTQSLYTQALLLLGGGTQPGEQPRVDILGARQTIDMLAIVAEKTVGNLTPDQEKLLHSALFDLRMGFLEITQALARQAAQRQPNLSGAPGGFPGGVGGPRIVR